MNLSTTTAADDRQTSTDGVISHDSAKPGHHHDTHALPPHFIQEVYSHYNKIKTEALDQDSNVVDFARGLTIEQKEALRSVGTVSAACINEACLDFRHAALGSKADSAPSNTVAHDAIIYEHRDFPGLQLVPGILPPETQVLFVSQIMHKYLSDPHHKINLEPDYDIEYPHSPTSESSPRSFFTYEQSAIHLSPKDASKHQPLNTAQFLSKKLRWLTLGDSQYDWTTRTYASRGPTTFPTDIKNLVTALFSHIRPESGVCLLYSGKDFMPVHRDVSEQCTTGLASFSFGCDGLFVVGRGEHEALDAADASKRTVVVRVRSGDCVHMDGETRWAWHAMPRTVAGTCPVWLRDWPVGTPGASVEERRRYKAWMGYFGRKRLNVSCRQVWD